MNLYNPTIYILVLFVSVYTRPCSGESEAIEKRAYCARDSAVVVMKLSTGQLGPAWCFARIRNATVVEPDPSIGGTPVEVDIPISGLIHPVCSITKNEFSNDFSYAWSIKRRNPFSERSVFSSPIDCLTRWEKFSSNDFIGYDWLPNEAGEKRFSNIRLLPDSWEQHAENAISETIKRSMLFNKSEISPSVHIELQQLIRSNNVMIRLAAACRLIHEGLLNKKNIGSQMQRCDTSQEASILTLLYLDQVENDVSSLFETLKPIHITVRKTLLEGMAIAALVCAKEDPQADVAFGAALSYRKKTIETHGGKDDLKVQQHLMNELMQHKAYELSFGIIHNLSRDNGIQSERYSNSALFQALRLLRVFPLDIGK